MASILHITDAASMAFHAMVFLAEQTQELVPAHKIAALLGVPKDHLAKVLQRLVKYELLLSFRGPNGGFKLCRGPDQITLLDIYEAIEGPLDKNNCLQNSAKCVRQTCIFGNLLRDINQQVSAYFGSATLSQLITKNANPGEDA